MAYVYILRSGETNKFKIGFTTGDVKKRVAELNTGNPEALTIFDVIESDEASVCEKYFHQTLRTRKYLGNGGAEFFELTPEELISITAAAREFMNDYITKKRIIEMLSAVTPQERTVAPTQEQTEIFQNLLALREKIDELNYQKEMLEFELKISIGIATELKGIATWKLSESKRFDQEAFKAQHEDLFNQFLKNTQSRKFLLARN